MTATATVSEFTIDSILDQLDRFHQRATYAAVAALVGASPRSLMAGRARDAHSSWIVSRRDGQPTGYQAEQKHPELASREHIIDSSEELRSWLANPV